MLIWLTGSLPATAHEMNAGDPQLTHGFDGAEVVILGEVHDNPAHHELQARLVEALNPGALVFEMLEQHHAEAAAGIARTNKPALETAFEWETRGWPDFAMYYPIFTALPEARLFGAALPRPDVRRAVMEGAAEVFGADAARFGLDQPLPEEELTARITLQDDAHCNALPTELLPGMVEAQRLRDAAMARATLAALEAMRAEDSPRPVVVITGNGHGRTDWGMPALLARVAPEVKLVSFAQFEEQAPERPAYHHWVITEAAEREDPCAAFAN